MRISNLDDLKVLSSLLTKEIKLLRLDVYPIEQHTLAVVTAVQENILLFLKNNGLK